MEKINCEIIKNLNGSKKRRFARTFLVHNHISNKHNVLKVADGEQIVYLQREKEFHFTNPQLPQVLNFVQDDHQAQLLLDHKEGVPIITHFNTLKKKERIQFVANFVTQLTRLLGEINDLSVVHLDIKPSNIIYNPETDLFALIDFGMGQKLPMKREKLIFPLGYAAPELILNKSDLVGLGTDLYSLGATLFHLWTGGIAHTHANPSIMTNLQIAYPLERPSKMPLALFKIIDGMMVKPKWPAIPTRLEDEIVEKLLIDSIKKREESLHSLQNHLDELLSTKRPNLLVKLFSKSNIKIEK